MSEVCDMKSLEDLGARLSLLGSMARGKVLTDAVMAGARVLQEQTRQQLVADVGEGALRKGLRGRPKYQNHPSMYEGVRVIRDAAYQTAIVSIMGDFRLKWYEKGTSERWAGGRKKKKTGLYPGESNGSAYRGRIRPEGFFLKARQNDTPIMEAIEKKLDKAITKALK